MLRLVASTALLLVLGGCALTDVKVADEKGQAAHCRAFGAGIIGTVVALGMTQSCVDEYKKQGFHEVPAATPAAAVTSSDQTK